MSGYNRPRKGRGKGLEPITNSGSSSRGGSSGGSVRGTGSGSGGSIESTLQPGQSVIPGSINIGDYPGYWTAHSPENVWWPVSEGKNALSMIWQLLTSSNNGASLSQQYADLLSLLTNISNDKKAALNPDLLISLFQNLLSYQTTQDQRGYDYRMLNESRLYNNPMNELSRYMGAGISRDAAIQMLSGSAGNLGGVGSGAASSIQPPAAGAGAATLNGSNAQANLVNNVFNGIQMIANLVGQGVSMAQAIEGTQALSMQNYMSQEQISAYNGVNEITKALTNAVSNGILEPADLDGWRNADDVYKWLVDHADTDLVKPLQQSGAIQRAFGSTIGREMFNHHWQQKRESEKGGDLFDNYFQQQTAATELANLDVKKSYQDLLYAIGELSRQDVEIQKLWNDVWLGNINIEIAGKQLKLVSYQENQAKTYNDIFNVAFNQTTGDGTPNVSGLGTGAGHLAFSMWNDLTMQFYKAFAQNGTKERSEAWERFFLNHNEAAQLLAGLELNMAQIDSAAGNPDLNPFTSTLIAIWRIAKMTGAYDVMQFGTNTALEVYKSNNLLTGMTSN